ncbi:MAG TPA: hypothetical protein VGN20_06340 [Mucilaginibacter sp.]|jgi:hypothetical protein
MFNKTKSIDGIYLRDRILKYILSVISILLINYSCNSCNRLNNENKTDQIGLFDISKDDRSILFSYIIGNKSSIYQIDTNGKGLKVIVPSTKVINYFNPKYSKKSQKILFLGKRNDLNTYNSSIYIANSDGTGIERITDGNEIISEAIFSDCEDKIYYCKAGEYGHSSPLGTDQAHGIDVYSIDLNNRKVERVTNLNAYGIFHISEYDCQNILMFIPVPDKEGMAVVPKIKTDKIQFIDPTNHLRENPSMYYAPVYSKKYNTLAFIATYELMQMSMDDKNAKVVVNQNNEGHSQIDNVVLFNNERKMAYTTDFGTEFILVCYDGSNLKHIKIPLK